MPSWSPPNGLKNGLRSAFEFVNAYRPEHRDARILEHLERTVPRRSVTPEARHLHAAISWIKRAQDTTDGGGVSWGYRMRRPMRKALPLGWIQPYPETTGYIIPTLARYGSRFNDADSLTRAAKMTAWETRIQLPDGGIQGGIYGAQPVESSTFVTGQVLFGFVDAYQRSNDAAVRIAAIRAGEWLLSCLDETGRFVRGHSHFCAPGSKAYEVRTALALAELADAVDKQTFRTAASAMADYALSCQQPNGWFDENDLEDNDRPLTHTIGYTLEGLHGLGTRLRRADCLDAVDRTLEAIIPLVSEDGFLAGRWHRDWNPAVAWACLTGSAQIAGVFLRRFSESRKSAYYTTGHRLLGFVCFTQDLTVNVPGIEGGIRGSYPVSGEYCQWCTINWAAKFFCDSLMDYLALDGAQGTPA